MRADDLLAEYGARHPGAVRFAEAKFDFDFSMGRAVEVFLPNGRRIRRAVRWRVREGRPDGVDRTLARMIWRKLKRAMRSD
jgi:hypothetical protein